jgi:hypothetical protein
MNIIQNWERKVVFCIKRSEHFAEKGLKEVRNKYYERAITYCDCIQNFTQDEDKFDCFDRLIDEYSLVDIHNVIN